MSRQEVRKEVQLLYSVDDVGEMVQGYIGDTETASLDALKIAEYALLVKPLSSSLAEYLGGAALGRRIPLSAPNLSIRESRKITVITQRILQESPELPLLSALHVERSKRLKAEQLGFLPALPEVIARAAHTATESMYGDAAANAIAIKQGGGKDGRSRRYFLEAVSNSTQLPLSHPLIHVNWERSVIDEIGQYGVGQIDGTGSWNIDSLVYDKERDMAVMKRRLQQWVHSEGLSYTTDPSGRIEGEELPRIEAIPTHDVRIGCPISFNPKLVIDFYQHFVGLIEFHRAWPTMVAS